MILLYQLLYNRQQQQQQQQDQHLSVMLLETTGLLLRVKAYQLRAEPYPRVRQSIEAVLGLTEDVGVVFTEQIPPVPYTLAPTPIAPFEYPYYICRQLLCALAEGVGLS